jgi:hypothetical protein
MSCNIRPSKTCILRYFLPVLKVLLSTSHVRRVYFKLSQACIAEWHSASRIINPGYNARQFEMHPFGLPAN